MNNDSKKYTVIYGGGAIRGVSYTGALKALNELNIEVGTIAGSSVGAVFAGLIAVGYNEHELKDLFLQINFDLFKDIHFGIGKNFALSKGEVFLEWIRDLIEQKYYGDEYKKDESGQVTFKDLEKNLVIITTDLTNFKYKEFSKQETPDFEVAKAIRISSTMPGLMLPIKYNNAELVDGDLQKSWPLWKLSKNLYPEDARVLEFRLEGDYNGKGGNTLDFINTVYSCVTSLATDFIIDRYGQKDKFDYIKINTGEVVIIDFNQPKEKREHLIQIGYEQTMKYFKSSLPKKKKKILKQYNIIYKHLNTLENHLERNQIFNAKLELGYLFMELHEANEYIDSKIFEAIRDLKEVFFDKLSEPNIFGMYPREATREVKKLLCALIKRVNNKVCELEEYITELVTV